MGKRRSIWSCGYLLSRCGDFCKIIVRAKRQNGIRIDKDGTSFYNDKKSVMTSCLLWAEAGMRESGENPEQYPLPYAGEAVVHGVSRSLGAILRRRSDRRGAVLHTPQAGRPMVFESGAHVGVRRESARKSGRGGSWDLPRPQLYAGDSDDEQKGRRPLC